MNDEKPEEIKNELQNEMSDEMQNEMQNEMSDEMQNERLDGMQKELSEDGRNVCMDETANDVVTEEVEGEKEEKNIFKQQGLWTGVFIGALAMGIICIVMVAIFSGQWKAMLRSQYTATTSLGSDFSKKLNTILYNVDQYFLYDYDVDDMENAIYKGLLDSLGDKYTSYYTPEEYKQLTMSTNGQYGGIGVAVVQEEDTNLIRTVGFVENAPGEEAGILVDDYIIAVDGKDITKMKLNDVITLLHGDEGTQVVVTVLRGEEKLDYEITRRNLDKTSVDYGIADDWLGYIHISKFDKNTTEQFKSAVEDLLSKDVKAFVFDIRQNPGGRIDTVKDILDYLLPEGILVYTMDKNGKRVDYTSDASAVLELPCVVLVDGNSASASEIFAGALQDYEKAYIIGTQTFGKGIVQSIIPLGDGSAIKITVEDYYTPNGNNIHGKGITPDEVVELDQEAAEAGTEDTQYSAAYEYLKKLVN